MNEEAQTLDEALDRLWRYALDVRREIDRAPPDLVVGLAHSAQLAVHAAQGLWQYTRSLPFPPTLITNLGREKKARYDAYRQERTLADYWAEQDGPEDVGFFLAWLAEQQDWQAQLRDQIAAVLGVTAAPKHILVLDERSAEGWTWGLTLGLLRLLFPAATTRFLAGHLGMEGWQLARCWLQEEHPASWPRVEADTQADPSGGVALSLPSHIDRVTLGTEDVEPAALAIRPLAPASPSLAQLADYLPPDAWLQLPAWAYARVTTEMRARAAWPPPRVDTWNGSIWEHQFEPLSLLVDYAARHGRITRRALMAMTGLNAHRAAYLLRRFSRPVRWLEGPLLVAAGRGRGAWYRLAQRAGVLLYGAPLVEPGPELAMPAVQRLETVTPFAVEFARAAASRAGAPILAPVPAGCGAPVPARILVLAPEITPSHAAAQLLRRARSRYWDWEEWEAWQASRPTGSVRQVIIERAPAELAAATDVAQLLYAAPQVNLTFVLDAAVGPAEQAARLAELAVASITSATYAAGADGIQYLAQMIAHGIHTPLTEPYRQAILRLTGAADLAAARALAAAQRGISTADP